MESVLAGLDLDVVAKLVLSQVWAAVAADEGGCGRWVWGWEVGLARACVPSSTRCLAVGYPGPWIGRRIGRGGTLAARIGGNGCVETSYPV